MWECMQKTLKLLILYPPLPHVSAFFKDHVAIIIKGALVPLQTYAMNIDRICTQNSLCMPVHMDAHNVIILQLELIDIVATVQNITS